MFCDENLTVSSLRKTLEEETRRLTVLCTRWSDILDNDGNGIIDDSTKVGDILR